MIDYSTLANTVGAFPTVTGKDATGPSTPDGTPYNEIVINDLWGAAQALLSAAGFAPDGNAEADGTSQRLAALKRLFGEQTLPPNISNEQIASKRFGSTVATGAPWGHMWSTQNSISAGGTTEIVDLAVAFADSKKYLLALDRSVPEVLQYDTDTLVQTAASGSVALLAGLPSGGGETWEPTAFCSDGTFVFIMFMDTAASPNETHYIQKYRVSDWSTGAAVGWPATGTALAGTGTNPFGSAPSNYGNDRVIIADDTNIATANSWIAATAGVSTCISIVTRAAGVITASGAGDSNNGAAIYPTGGGLVSDGTNIFWGNRDGAAAANSRYCSAVIAGPTAGIGSGGWPTDVGSKQGIRGAGFDGDISYAFVDSNSIDPIIASVGDSTFGTIDISPAFFNALTDATFDGSFLWVMGNDGAGQVLVVKIDVSALETGANTFETYLRGVFYFDTAVISAGNTNVLGRILFDGRDVWMVADKRAGQTFSGVIRRTPRAMVR